MTVVAPVSAARLLAVIGAGGANGTEIMFKPLASVTLIDVAKIIALCLRDESGNKPVSAPIC